MWTERRIRRAVAALGLALAASAVRAGGHLEVDDAGTLDPGRCQVELWAGRTGAEPVRVWHLAPACRVGPVQVNLNVDRTAVAGAPDEVVLGPQLK